MTEHAPINAKRRFRTEQCWRFPVTPPPNAGGLLVPWWIAPVLIACALMLAPWIAWLLASLPSHAVAHHWQLVWGGFDIALAALLAATGIALIRRSPIAGLLAPMTATLLIADAWFDVITSLDTSALPVAVAEAAFAELPLAFVCLWIARNVERVLADARPFLERAGFRIERRRLVAPEPDAAAPE
jgi:hypothetical protein